MFLVSFFEMWLICQIRCSIFGLKKNPELVSFLIEMTFVTKHSFNTFRLIKKIYLRYAFNYMASIGLPLKIQLLCTILQCTRSLWLQKWRQITRAWYVKKEETDFFLFQIFEKKQRITSIIKCRNTACSVNTKIILQVKKLLHVKIG